MRSAVASGCRGLSGNNAQPITVAVAGVVRADPCPTIRLTSGIDGMLPKAALKIRNTITSVAIHKMHREFRLIMNILVRSTGLR